MPQLSQDVGVQDPHEPPYAPYQSGAQLLSEDDSSYKVQTPGGQTVTINKGAITPQTKTTITQLPKSSDYAGAGGRSPASESNDPGFFSQQYWLNALNKMQGHSPDPQPGSQQSSAAPAISPSASTQSAPAPMGVAPPDPSRLPAPGVPIQMPAAPPGLGNPMQDYMRNMNASINDSQSAANQQSKADIGILQNQNDMLKKQQDVVQQTHQKLDNEMTSLGDGIRNKSIDPGHFWASKTSGQKVGLWVGSILSGMGGDGNYINRLIDRDIDAQKSDQSNKQNLYKLNLDRFKNTMDAENMTRLQNLQAVSTQLEIAKAQAVGPQAKAAAEAARAGIAQQMIPYAMQFTNNQIMRQINTSGVPASQFASLPPAVQEQIRPTAVPYNGVIFNALTSDDAKSAKDLVAHVQPAQDAIRQLIEINKGLGVSGRMPNTEDHVRAESLMALIEETLGPINGINRLTDQSVKLAKEQLGDPTDPFSGLVGPKLQQTLKGLQTKLDSELRARITGNIPIQAPSSSKYKASDVRDVDDASGKSQPSQGYSAPKTKHPMGAFGE